MKCFQVRRATRYPSYNCAYSRRCVWVNANFAAPCSTLGTLKPETITRTVAERTSASIQREKGLAFWIRELGARRAKLGLRKADYVYDRRFICPDCVSGVLAPL